MPSTTNAQERRSCAAVCRRIKMEQQQLHLSDESAIQGKPSSNHKKEDEFENSEGEEGIHWPLSGKPSVEMILSKTAVNRPYNMVAITRTQENSNNRFTGAGMITSVWNPRVEGQQHSVSRVKIQNGSDILQAGWRVDPTLYGDTKTRRFIHFQAGNAHCFNTLCPGFIIVNTKIPVDWAYDHVSHIGDLRIWQDEMTITRDLVGNWWLVLETEIGFWPQRIFTELKSFATNVEWGGVVYSPQGVPSPPMGTGLLPIADTSRAAFCKKLIVLNDKGKTIDVGRTTVHSDVPYEVLDIPHWEPAKSQHIVFYGGPS